MRRVLSVLLLAVLLAGCDRGGPVAPAAGPPGPDVATMLADAWMTDGDRGFFAEGLSLYETRWRLALHPGAVDVQAVQRWVPARIAADADRSGLPDIAQLDLAVRILRSAGAPVDPAAVGRRLSGLRHDWGFRADPSATAADWGSTAVAVRLSVDHGLPVPVSIAHRIRSTLAAPSDLGPAAVAAVLETAAAVHGAGIPRDLLLAAQHAVIEVTRTAEPDASLLSLLVGLRHSSAALSLPDPPAVPCGRARLTDPQAIAAALELNCPGVRRPDPGPHGRAGWPTPEALAGSLASSAAGLAAARTAGVAEPYLGPLTRQVREVWLPATPGGTALRDRVARVNLKLLARALGGPVLAEVNRARPAPAGKAGSDPVVLLTLTEFRLDPAAGRDGLDDWLAPLLTRAGPPSALRAAWLAEAAVLLDRPDLTDRARTMLAGLRAQPAGYAATTGGRPSLIATAIAGQVLATPAAMAAGANVDDPAGWTLQSAAYHLGTPFPVAF